MNFFKSPLVRISLGLVVVTISTLLVIDIIGLVPDVRRAELKSRQVIAESLAVQFSRALAEDQFTSVEETLKILVERNEDVLSAGIRLNQGNLIVHTHAHDERWTLQKGDNSTATQIQLALFDGNSPWGTIELHFDELGQHGGEFDWRNSFPVVVGLVAVICFIGYMVFLKRTLKELDPSAVIPERVRLALDTLAEGLLIVDQDNTIVFSNQSFSRKTSLTASDLIGRPCTSLSWVTDHEEFEEEQALPWVQVLAGGQLEGGEHAIVKLTSGLDKVYKFAVNASTITSAEGEIRGALITFDDVTEVERKNEELELTLVQLERSQLQITKQNEELHVLATRDPLTGLLNRRSFFESFESMITDALHNNDNLGCMVVDIDHFKTVNDTFGHSVGDVVIKLLSTVLTDYSRPGDFVGRFGGEEFCIALPGADKEAAFAIAERMRCAIEETNIEEFNNTHSITISIGITDLSEGATNVAEMFDQADKALYVAKESGRNRCIRWPSDTDSANEPAPAQGPATRADTPDAVVAQETKKISTDAVSSSQAVPSEGQAPSTNTAAQIAPANPSAASPLAPLQQSNNNRSLLIDRINQAVLRSQRYDTKVAVLAVEFDVLQRVNEAMGASVGAKLEQEIAKRLQKALRRTDTVSISGTDELMFSVLRTGGKEIVLLLTDLQDTDVITTIVQRIFTLNSAAIQVEDVEYYLDADVGVSIYPVDSADGDRLLTYANSAMREAKKSVGGNNCQFYSADVNDSSKRQLHLEADLHVALDRGELVAFYQPKVCLKTGSIVGMEALLRWEHPQLGMVSPLEFIALAERSSLIDDITRRVMTAACRQIRVWQDAGYGTVPIAVNMSPVQFRNADLADQIISLVGECDVSPSAIEIEITETVVVQNMQTAIDILEKLSEAGFSIAIDDFGVGYSSFSYLKKFPVNKIKIDRSFVTDLSQGANHAAIISAMIAMGHSLGLCVVAEGVETEEELRFLQDLQCDQVQGYFFSRPLPPEEISQLLSDSSSIKRMVQAHDQAVSQPTSKQGGGSMFGIINEFSAEVLSESKLAVPDSESKKA